MTHASETAGKATVSIPHGLILDNLAAKAGYAAADVT